MNATGQQAGAPAEPAENPAGPPTGEQAMNAARQQAGAPAEPAENPAGPPAREQAGQQSQDPAGKHTQDPDGQQAGEPAGQRPAAMPGLPPLRFPEQPTGQGPLPAPGGYSPQFPAGRPADSSAPGQQPPGSQWPPGGRPLPPRQPMPKRQRPSQPPGRELRHRAFAGLVFALLSLIALLGAVGNLHRGIYLVIFTLLAGPGGCALGITASRRARRAGAWRPRGALGATIIGGLSTLLGLMTLTAFILFSQQLAAYSQCLSRAQTSSAQQACLTQFQRAIDARIQSGSG